jgi:SNF2 family DNA or RNA helicase
LVPQCSSSTHQLYPYQIKAIDHIIANPRCAIFASMGSGKTRIVLEALHHLPKPVLVVAPKRVAKHVWPDEVSKWRPDLSIVCIEGTPKQRKALLQTQADIYTINFEQLQWFEAYAPLFKTIIVDESSKLRGFRLRQGTKSTQALNMIDTAEHFIELTGTPAPQGIIDLYGQLYFLDGGQRLGRTFSAFTSRFFSSIPMPGGYTKLIPLKNSFSMVMDRIKDICLTIDVRDYLDIAEPIHRVIDVALPSDVITQYQLLEQEMITEIGDHTITVTSAAIASNKLLQMTSGCIYDEDGRTIYVHDEKTLALDDVLEEWAHQSVIVVYWFKSTLEKLQKKYPHGKTIDGNISAWNNGQIELMFIHPQSAGHGLNLALGGNVMVFYDLNWNLELYQQVIERIGPTRQKQADLDRPVFIYYLMAKDTIDSRVMKVLRGKMTVQTALLDGLK